MIQLIEAPPRSGKSYFAVNYLCGFTKYDALYDEYILNPEVLIISNIEGLKIKHWELDYVLKDQTIETFFNIQNFERIMEKTGKTHIILAIDECHRIFPNGYKDDAVYDFFAFHGHLGLDIILMTQGIQSMSRMLNPLLEFVIKATPRSKKLFNSFSYKYYDLRGKFLYPKSIKTKDSVFHAYQSFRHDESNKPKSAAKIWITFVAVLLILGVVLFKFAIGIVTDRGHDARTKVSISELRDNKKTVSATPVSGGAAPDPVVIVDSPPIKQVWETLYLDGYAVKGGVYWYFYNRNPYKHDDKRFRNFDSVSKTVEYFGKKIIPHEGAPSSPNKG